MLTNNFSAVKVSFISIAMIAMSSVILSACGGGADSGLGALNNRKKNEIVKQPVLSESKEGRDDPIASQIALKYAGFSKKTPDGYWYADTKIATKPTKSFGVFSKSSNQQILFLVFDDNTATQKLSNFAAVPPYTNVPKVLKPKQISQDEKPLPSGEKFKYILSDYPRSTNTEAGYFRALVGGMPSIIDGKSIMVVAKAFDDTQAYNHTNTLFILDHLSKDRKKPEKVEAVAEEAKPTKELSTPEQIEKFMTVTQEAINENLSLPEKIVKAAKKHKKKDKKEKKWKGTQLLVGVNAKGKLSSLGDKTTVPTEENKMIVKSLIEAVQSIGTFKDAPVVEAKEFKFVVRLHGTKAEVKKEVEKDAS